MDVEIWKQVKVCFGKDLVMDTVSIVSTSSSILHISQSTVSAIANTAGWGWCHGQLWSHGSTTCLAVETWLEIVSKIAWILHLNGRTHLWISPTSRFEFAELSATGPTSSLNGYGTEYCELFGLKLLKIKTCAWIWGPLDHPFSTLRHVPQPCLAKGATKYWDLRRRPRWLLGVIQTNRKAFGFHTESAVKWHKFHKGLKGVT